MTQKRWRQVAVCTIIFVIFCILPPMGPMARADFVALGGFVTIIVSMVMELPAWYNLLILLAYCLISNVSFGDVALPAAMGTSTIWLLLSLFWFMAAIKDSGIFRFLSERILALKIARKGLYWLTTIFLVASFVVSMVTQVCSAVAVFLLMMLADISDSLGMKRYNMWTVSTGIGVAVVGLIGNITLPFNWVTQVYYRMFQGSLGLAVLPGDLTYTLVLLTAAVITMVIIIAFTKFILRPKVDTEKLKNIDIKITTEFDKTIKGTMVSLIVLILLMVLPSILPKSWTITTILGNFGTPGAFTMAAFMQCFVKDRNGEPLFDFGSKLRESTELSTALTLGAILYIGNILNNAEGGFAKLMAQVCAPLGTLPPILLIAVIGLICILMTNATNNFLPCLITGPIGFAVLGYETKWAAVFALFMVYNSWTALAFPTASATGLVLHGQPKILKRQQVILWGYVYSIFAWAAGLVSIMLFQGMF